MSVGPNELDLEPKGLRAKASRARLSEPLNFVEPDSYHQLLGGVSTIFLHRPDCQKRVGRDTRRRLSQLSIGLQGADELLASRLLYVL
jgi:hypothetical protein